MPKRRKADAVVAMMGDGVRTCHIPDMGFDHEGNEDLAHCGARFYRYALDLKHGPVEPVVCPSCYLRNHTKPGPVEPLIVKQLVYLIEHGT